MKLRIILFVIFSGLHLMLILLTPEFLAPAIAGTIYLPLMPFQIIDLPVFAAAQSGGWSSPSLFGWAIVTILWVVVWWGLASYVSRFFCKRIPHA